jgi:group II intron reverse transcriptase/maturase
VDSAGAEVVEGRRPAKGNAGQQNAYRTQRRESAPSALHRVREAASRDRKARFTALFHHITLDVLRSAFFSLEKSAAPGVDGVMWQQYAQGYEDKLKDLHDRLQRGAYRARPSRRVFIPKAEGRQRPLGIAALEDKVVQRAVVEVLSAIYEVDFLGFSYGFRPGRSQHDALDALHVGLTKRKVNWVLDADIRGFFDAVDHEWMIKLVEHRIADKRLLRLIQKWLSAGVVEDGRRSPTEEGTPQGATVSPLLSNVYLHYVLDRWIDHWRNRYARGDVIIVRYADDFVIGFQHRDDAERLKRALAARLQRFALELHPGKTRLIEFGRFAARDRAARREGKPETFDFLGFTHICAKARSDGRFTVRRRTMQDRQRRKLRAIKEELHRRRHQSIPEQGKWLGAVVRGYFAYHAVPLNTPALEAFRREVVRHWLHALRRRSQRHRMPWTRMARIARRWLPPVRVQHLWPLQRFLVITRGRSPVR